MAIDFKHLIRKTHQKIKDFHGRVKARAEAFHQGGIHESPVQVLAETKPQKTELIIPASTMAKFVAIAILLLVLTAFLYQIRDILVIFFVSLLFAAALDPMVDSLEARRIPRGVGVILIYLVIFGVLGFIISNLIPVVAGEVSQLASRIQDFVARLVSGKIELPRFLEGLRPSIQKLFEGLNVSKIGDYKEILLNIANKLSDVAGNVVNAVVVVFNGFFNTILVLVITFLMTVDERGMDKFILSIFPTKYGPYIREKSNAIKEKMGHWLRGQVALCFIVGILVYIGFLIIGLFTQKVEYAATIALVAGLTELIPYAGPFIAWLIALPIVANQSLMLIVWMTVLMYVTQFLENNFIVPMVMHKAVGISPIFIMFAMFVGFSFLGVLGIVLSVPVATAVAIFFKDFAQRGR